MLTEIITLLVDIGLGAIAYYTARTVKKENTAIRAELEAVKKFLKGLGWRGLDG